jgi:hypothetical protein
VNNAVGDEGAGLLARANWKGLSELILSKAFPKQAITDSPGRA